MYYCYRLFYFALYYFVSTCSGDKALIRCPGLINFKLLNTMCNLSHFVVDSCNKTGKHIPAHAKVIHDYDVTGNETI